MNSDINIKIISEDKIRKFFDLALFQAKLFSKDPTRQVAALFIEKDSLQLLSAGYNGFPRKLIENSERWNKPLKYKYVVHAEANGIYNACRNGVNLKDSICIVTFFPCSECTKALIQVGISYLITTKPDFSHKTYGNDFKFSIEMFNELNIPIIYI